MRVRQVAKPGWLRGIKVRKLSAAINDYRAMRFAAAAAMFAVILTGYPGVASVSVLTYHNDISRTGANTAETILTPADVNSCTFGKLFSLPVDGHVYAQPLYMSGLAVKNKGTHNVVFVATMHDSVYAFDADDASGPNSTALWSKSFLNPPSVTSVPNGDVGNGYGDIEREIGICGTPVIDPSTNTLYLVAKTRETSGANVSYVQRLHALDVSSGDEKFGGPLVISAAVAGTGYNGNYGVFEDVTNGVVFDPRNENQRPGLLLVNGVVYIGWSAHEDHDPYHGWLMAYAVDSGTSTLKQVGVYCVTPNGGRGGIWQGGAGPAADSAGAIYLATGNGTYGAPSSCDGDSYLKLAHGSNTLSVTSFFTPSNQADLDAADLDVGSGGVVLLPDQPGTHQHVLVGCGKEGAICLLDRDALGGYNSVDQTVQRIPGVIAGVWGVPAYWNSNVYFGAYNNPVTAFSLSGGTLGATPGSQTNMMFGYPGTVPAISSNGTSNGIVWALDLGAYASNGPAILHAFDANNLQTELYNSGQAGTRDTLGQAIKFAVPTVANGKVYVGTGTELDVLGLGVPFAVASAKSTGPASVQVGFSCQVDPPSAQTIGAYSLDNGASVIGASVDAGGASVTLTTSPLVSFVKYTLTVSGVQDTSNPPRTVPPGSTATFSLSGLSGLTGAYYSNVDLSGAPVLQRIDPSIDFDWNEAGPDPAVGQTAFSVRWTGYVQPPTTGTYTFYAVADDGVRLWVNGRQLVNGWVLQGPTEYSGSLPLTGGTKYPITMEYYQAYGGAVARLLWSGPSVAKAPVPPSGLFARGYDLADVAYVLASSGGLHRAADAQGLSLSQGVTLDLRQATLLLRKAAGLDANP